MDIWLIAGIVVFGLLVIMVEIFLIPGTTVIGIIGGVITVIGVVMAYIDHGVKAGSLMFAGAAVATAVLLYFGFKAYSSRKFSLNEVIDSRVDVLDIAAVGDEGVTINYLRPNGKAVINNNKVEVYSQGEYIEGGKKIKVVKIAENKIYVRRVEEGK